MNNSSIFNFKLFSLKWLLPFLFSVFLIGKGVDYVFTQFIILKNPTLEVAKVHTILTTDKETEIPIYGSSRAADHYVCDSIHTDCFNYGIRGIGKDVLIGFLKIELAKKRQTPIILNVDYTFHNSGGDINAFIPWVNHPEIRQMLGEKQIKTTYFIPFFRYFGTYENYLKDYLNAKNNFTTLSDKKGGRYETRKIPTKHFADLVVKRKETKTRFIQDSLNIVFYELIKSTNRPVFVVFSPIHASFFAKFSYKAEADAYFKTIADLPNAHIIQMSNFISADSLFFDTSHLNYEGAKIFSRALRDSIHSHLHEVKP